jgi:predicted RNA binding protein YcfA (HicA-like mRNA interferase family)
VPVHGGKDMKRGTLKSVLEALGVSVRELKEL